MKKLLLLVIMLVSASMYCTAQNYKEVVYLKNGSIIKGVIIEQIPNVSLKIKTGDGSLIICQMDEVEKITKEVVYRNDNQNTYRKSAKNTLRGYKGFVDFGYVGDVSDYNASKVGVTTSHGYQFNNYLFLGGGVGLDYFTELESVSVPMFANFRANFINKKVTPFADLKAGYSVGDVQGAMVTLGVGVRFSISEKKAINLKLEYNYQEYVDSGDYVFSSGDYHYASSWDSTYDFTGIGLKIGFEF